MPNNITKLRKAKGLLQRELAEKIGVSTWHMNKMENGEKNVTMKNAMKIAEVLGVTLNDIFLDDSCPK